MPGKQCTCDHKTFWSPKESLGRSVHLSGHQEGKTTPSGGLTEKSLMKKGGGQC